MLTAATLKGQKLLYIVWSSMNWHMQQVDVYYWSSGMCMLQHILLLYCVQHKYHILFVLMSVFIFKSFQIAKTLHMTTENCIQELIQCLASAVHRQQGFLHWDQSAIFKMATATQGNKLPKTDRFLFFLHASGHLGHRSIDGGILGQVGDVFCPINGQIPWGIQSTCSELAHNGGPVGAYEVRKWVLSTLLRDRFFP